MAAKLITGTGGAVALPSGFSGKLTSWAGTLTVADQDITGFDDSGWLSFVETCSSFTGSAAGWAQYDASGTKPAPFVAGSNTGSFTLTALAGCTLAFSGIMSSVNMSRQNCQAMPLTFNFKATGPVAITWDVSGA